MKWFRFTITFLLLLLLVGIAGRAIAGNSPLTLSAGSFAFADHDTSTGEYAASGPSPAVDGYVGTFSYNYSISSGSGTLTYLVCYTVSYYDASTSSWETYDQGYTTITAAAGSSGTKHVDFYADLSTGIPDGAYQCSAWVCTGTGSSVSGVLGGADDLAGYVFGYYPTGSLPSPEPSPGPVVSYPPAVVRPELPPTGPVGPGTS